MNKGHQIADFHAPTPLNLWRLAFVVVSRTPMGEPFQIGYTAYTVL